MSGSEGGVLLLGLLPFIFFMILGFGSRMPIEKAEPAALPSTGSSSFERESEEDSPFTAE